MTGSVHISHDELDRIVARHKSVAYQQGWRCGFVMAAVAALTGNLILLWLK